jgi:hypothetical protein
LGTFTVMSSSSSSRAPWSVGTTTSPLARKGGKTWDPSGHCGGCLTRPPSGSWPEQWPQDGHGSCLSRSSSRLRAGRCCGARGASSLKSGSVGPSDPPQKREPHFQTTTIRYPAFLVCVRRGRSDVGLPGADCDGERPMSWSPRSRPTGDRAACASCGTWNQAHERMDIATPDLPCFGRPAPLT